MPRIRTVKPEFWTDARVCRVSRDARLLFLGLLNESDDEGRQLGSPKRIAGALFPHDDDVDARTVTSWLAELDDAGLVCRYAVDGIGYVAIPKFRQHQRIDKPSASKYPAPPAHSTKPPRTFVEAMPVGSGSGSGSGKKSRPLVDPATPAPPADWQGIEPVQQMLAGLNGSVPDGFDIDQFRDPKLWRELLAVTDGTGVYLLDEFRLYLAWWPTKPPSERHRNLRQGFRRWIKRDLGREQWRKERQNAARPR